MRRVRRVVQSGVYSEPWRALAVGQRVQVRFGPLSGLEGELIFTKENMRLVIGVTLLQRYVAEEVSAADVVPVGSAG